MPHWKCPTITTFAQGNDRVELRPERLEDLYGDRVDVCYLDQNHPEFDRMFEAAKFMANEIYY